MSRLGDLERFYQVMDMLRLRVGGNQYLRNCNGRMNWPEQGVYFFFENSEPRTHTGSGTRVVRVGTHALAKGSKSTLWRRLSQHAGRRSSGTGNHRGSIFRLLVGEAIKRRDGLTQPETWGVGGHAGAIAQELSIEPTKVRDGERALEISVSRWICDLPFLIVNVHDDPGPDSARGVIEHNSIALLSNLGKEALDTPSREWLGMFSGRDRVRRSGLWNNRHVEETHHQDFLDVLERAVSVTPEVARTVGGAD